MRKNIFKLGAGLAALSALALGGSALASAGHKATPLAPPAATAPVTATPSTSIPDAEVNAATEPSGSAADTDKLQDTTSPDSASGTADAETKDAAEPAGSGADKADASGATDSGSESTSEIAGNDGPGGHADEPGNPGADHQAVGKE